MQGGDIVTVHFDIESREFNGRWYTDIKAWKVEKATNSADNTSSSTPVINTPVIEQSPEDDLPF